MEKRETSGRQSARNREELLQLSEQKLRNEAERGKMLLELYEKAPNLSEKQLYDYALDCAVKLTGSIIGFFHLVSPDQQEIVLTTWNSAALQTCVATYDAHYPIELAGNWVDCVRLKRPVLYNDFAHSPNQKGLPAGHTPLYRFMSIPVMEGDDVRIIFGVGNKSDEYDDHDVVNIHLVANELQKIIRQRRIEESLRRLNEELEQRVQERTAELSEKNAELQQAYNDLKTAQSQLQQQDKMASIGQLAAGVAHEINNPMGFIISNLSSLGRYVEKLSAYLDSGETILNDCESTLRERIALERHKYKIDRIRDDLPDLISESLEGAERVRRIVMDLKRFSRNEETVFAYADINDGLESALSIVWNELKYKATVTREYGQLPPVWCNIGQLNQVFLNLLVNAAHSIETSGEIRVETAAENGSVRIVISDTGCGIPAENLNLIFDPFFTTKEVGKGTGLGLAIAYGIVVNKHGGTIFVASEIGKGSTFTISLPVKQRIASDEPGKP